MSEESASTIPAQEDERDKPRRPRVTDRERQLLDRLLLVIDELGRLVEYGPPSEIAHALLDLTAASYLAVVAGTPRELQEGRKWARAFRANSSAPWVEFSPAVDSNASADGKASPTPFWPYGIGVWSRKPMDVTGLKRKKDWGEIASALRDVLLAHRGHDDECVATMMLDTATDLLSWTDEAKAFATAQQAEDAFSARAVFDARRTVAGAAEATQFLAARSQVHALCAARTEAIANLREQLTFMRIKTPEFWDSASTHLRFVRKVLLKVGLSSREVASLVRGQEEDPREEMVDGHKPDTWSELQNYRSLPILRCSCRRAGAAGSAGSGVDEEPKHRS